MSTNVVVSPPPAIAPLGVGVLRSLRVEFRAIHDGRELISPDGRFTARAISTYGPRLFSRSSSYYEFVVENRAGTQLQQIKVQVPREALINWRLEGDITWSDDSSAVTFKFSRQCLTLSIDLRE
jgi:hypothetical protein